METTMYDTLLQLPLFQGLCKNDFTNILGKVKLHFHKYKPDNLIVKQGETCKQLTFLLNGEIISEAKDTRNIYALYETFQGPYLIEPYSLFGMKTKYTATYRARTNADVVTIDKSFVLSELNKYEIFRLNYLNILSNRAQVAYEKLWNLHIGGAHEKVMNFLILRSKKLEGEKLLKIKMEDLACLIDETRINVSKVLNNLQELGLVQLSRKEIYIPEMEKLMEENIEF